MALAFWALSSWLKNKPNTCDPLPVWDWFWAWMALGWPKRGPRATQASRKGRPKGRFDEVPLVATKSKKGRRGGGAENSQVRRSETPRRAAAATANDAVTVGFQGPAFPL